MTIPLDDLGGQGNGSESQLLADQLLNARVDVGIGAHRTGQLAHRNDLLRMLHPLDIPLDLRIPKSKLEAEGHGLRMDAMGAPDAGSMLELLRPATQNLPELSEVIENDVSGIPHHHADGSILHIAGSEPLVDVLGIIPHMLRHIRQESDDIVMGHGLDLLDAADLELCLGADVHRRLLRDLAEFCHGIAGSHLHIQDGLPLVLDGPKMPHLLTGIALNHSIVPLEIRKKYTRS